MTISPSSLRFALFTLFALLGLVLSGCDNGQIDDTSPEGDDDTIIDNDDDDAVADDDNAGTMSTAEIDAAMEGVQISVVPTDGSREGAQCTTYGCNAISLELGGYKAFGTKNKHTLFCEVNFTVVQNQVAHVYIPGGQAPSGSYSLYDNEEGTGSPLGTPTIASSACTGSDFIVSFEGWGNYTVDGTEGAASNGGSAEFIEEDNSVVKVTNPAGSTFYLIKQ